MYDYTVDFESGLRSTKTDDLLPPNYVETHTTNISSHKSTIQP